MIYPHLPRLALSILQPWGHSIIHLGKPVENRDWSTKIRGEIAVHVGQKKALGEWRRALETYRFAGASFDQIQAFPHFQDLPTGGIIGTVEIVDCVTEMNNAWFFGYYGFVLANPKPVEFIKVKGALGFFDWRKQWEKENG